MKKFTDITNKNNSLDFKKSKSIELSNDINDLDSQLEDQIKSTILDGEWEIVNIVDVSMEEPKTNEAIIINAELGDKGVKRGDFIYITALIQKRGSQYHQNQMGVLKVRVVEIYNTLLVLNQLR
jgi:hypothetical protein